MLMSITHTDLGKAAVAANTVYRAIALCGFGDVAAETPLLIKDLTTTLTTDDALTVCEKAVLQAFINLLKEEM